MNTNMAVNSKPLVLLIPGAFAKPSCFDVLVANLHSKGYETAVSSLPSSDPAKPEECTCAADANYIRETNLLPLIEQQGKDVVLFAHSYGALCGGVAVDGLLKSVRKEKSENGGVIGLIYLAGTMIPENITLLGLLGNQWPPYIKVDKPHKGCGVIEPVINILYGDADQKDVHKLEASMTPHALSAFTTKSPRPGSADSEFNGRRVYIRTSQDHCQPPGNQDLFMKSSEVDWIVEKLDASHGAFFTRSEDVANLIATYATKWA